MYDAWMQVGCVCNLYWLVKREIDRSELMRTPYYASTMVTDIYFIVNLFI